MRRFEPYGKGKRRSLGSSRQLHHHHACQTSDNGITKLSRDDPTRLSRLSPFYLAWKLIYILFVLFNTRSIFLGMVFINIIIFALFLFLAFLLSSSQGRIFVYLIVHSAWAVEHQIISWSKGNKIKPGLVASCISTNTPECWKLLFVPVTLRIFCTTSAG